MVEQSGFQLQGSAAQMYEEQQVPALFRPLAEATLRQIDVHEGTRVTDVACGTWILGRLVAEKVGESGMVIGIDIGKLGFTPTSGAGLILHACIWGLRAADGIVCSGTAIATDQHCTSSSKESCHIQHFARWRDRSGRLVNF